MFNENYKNTNRHHKLKSVEMMVFGDTVVDIMKYEFLDGEGKIITNGK